MDDAKLSTWIDSVREYIVKEWDEKVSHQPLDRIKMR